MSPERLISPEKRTKTSPFPYIGITGFTSPEDVEEFTQKLSALKKSGELKGDPVIALGVLASRKTIMGGEIDPRWASQFPPSIEQLVATISSINDRTAVCNKENNINVISSLHLVYYKNWKKKENQKIFRKMIERMAENHLAPNLIQVDSVWPPPRIINSLRNSFPNSRIILQLGSKAIKEAGLPLGPSERLRSYNVDCVLLDPSSGTGQSFNPNWAINLIESIRESPVAIAIAGGLGPNREDIQPLNMLISSGISNIGVDAQGKLMDPNTHRLDPNRAIDYVRRTAPLIFKQEN